MKRLLVLIIAILLSTTTCALANSCPLPPVNTDADIQFSGFEWYVDYPTMMKMAEAKGIDTLYSMDWFSDSSYNTPHWPIVYSSMPAFAEGDMKCGGSVVLVDLPDVAGYTAQTLEMYFMWNPETGYTKDYQSPDAIQFYMARYEIQANDIKACYEDLVNKLKSLYGESPFEDTKYEVMYSIWVNNQNALIGIGCFNSHVNLVYMAPNADEKLVAIEELVKGQEIDDAADDFSGL